MFIGCCNDCHLIQHSVNSQKTFSQHESLQMILNLSQRDSGCIENTVTMAVILIVIMGRKGKRNGI